MPDALTATPAPLEARAAALARLADEHWDVVVIGGGIVGSGVLLDAVSRGLRAALVEQDDLAVGTSSRSSRLIHGGVRYLEDMRLQLVREALAERSRLMTLAPHLVRLERFLFPVYGWPVVHRAMFSAGLTLYDLLGAARDGGRAHHLGAGAVAELIPPIVRHRLRGGVTYSDGVEDDARYSIAVARTAIAMGATAVTRTRATGLLTADDGRVTGLTVRDLLGGAELAVRAGRVIDATGVWLGHPEARLGGSTMKLVPSRGSHLLFERERIPIGTGMTLKIPGRVLFLIPSPGAWIVGTTDEPDAGAPDRPAPTGHEVDHILETVNGVLALDLSRKDALGAYAGLRPLVGAPGGDTARISREHTIHREASGLVRVSGGKYTTYRIMARDAVDMALEGLDAAPRSSTAGLTLSGAAPRDELDRLASELAAHDGLDATRAAALVNRHGRQARDVLALGRELDLLRPLADDIPQLEAEVAWAVRHELALGLDDVLSRRMRLSMARRDRCASIAPRVAAIMGADLGWDESRQAAEVDAFLTSARREYDVPAAEPGDPGPADVSERFVLALDQGTTSSRAIVFDQGGQPVAAAQQEYPQGYPFPGHVTHDPEDIWQSQLAVARQALDQVPGGIAGIAALGVTNQRETTIVWERATGRPVAPAIVWQSRITAERCADLREAGHEPRVRALTGLPLDAYFSGPKIAHILDAEPGLRARAEAGELCFGTVDSFLVWRLTGGRSHLTDVSNASRTLLFDISAGRWDPWLCETVGVPMAMLPQVRPSSALLAETDPGILGASLPIGGIAGDQMAAMFGQACLAPGRAKSTYGTGAFTLLNTGSQPIASQHGLLSTVLWQLGDAAPLTYALEGAVFVAGAAVRWLRDGLRAIERSSDVEALAARGDRESGVVVVPAFVGLGAPYWDPDARGTIAGLTLGSRLEDIVLATVDAMAYQVADVLGSMTLDAGGGLAVLRVDGGAAVNDALMQFQADILDVPVERPQVTETTALGAAFLAGLATGVWSSTEEIAATWRLEQRFEPAMDGTERERLLGRWRRAVERARGWASG